jgi:hypothetical protein
MVAVCWFMLSRYTIGDSENARSQFEAATAGVILLMPTRPSRPPIQHPPYRRQTLEEIIAEIEESWRNPKPEIESVPPPPLGIDPSVFDEEDEEDQLEGDEKDALYYPERRPYDPDDDIEDDDEGDDDEGDDDEGDDDEGDDDEDDDDEDDEGDEL